MLGFRTVAVASFLKGLAALQRCRLRGALSLAVVAKVIHILDLSKSMD